MIKTTTYARMRQKADAPQNWKEVEPLFSPGKGELIIYHEEKNSSTKNKDGEYFKTRMKIGDGTTALRDLDFLAGEVYCQNSMPDNAGDGAVWVTQGDDGDESVGIKNYLGLAPQKITVSKDSDDTISLAIELEQGMTLYDKITLQSDGTPIKIQVDGRAEGIPISWAGFGDG